MRPEGVPFETSERVGSTVRRARIFEKVGRMLDPRSRKTGRFGRLGRRLGRGSGSKRNPRELLGSDEGLERVVAIRRKDGSGGASALRGDQPRSRWSISMDTITLVENQIDDGERLLERLGEHGIAVRAAGWAKPAGDDRWFFYIATPLVDEQGPLAAYKEVYRVLRSMHGAWIRDSEIKLVGDRHPVSKDLVNLVSRYPGPTSTISHRAILGDLQVDEIYVYAEPELKGYAEMKRLFPSAQIFAVAVRGGHDAAEVFSKARPLVGKVNAAEFEGKEPESLLLMGPKGPTT